MDQGEFALSDREFNRVKARVYKEAGIALSDQVPETIIVEEAEQRAIDGPVRPDLPP